MAKHELRVSSSKLRVTTYDLKDQDELRFKSESLTLRVTSLNPGVTSSNP